MKYFVKKITTLALLTLIYSLFFYFLIHQQLNTDFPAFYGATLTYIHDGNPFIKLNSDFLGQDIALPININPPIFLQLLIPITYLSYANSWLLWSIASLIFGLLGALLCLYLATDKAYFKKNYFWCSALYLLTYSSLMNTSVSQIGGFLLFFVMLGYLFYLKNYDFWAGSVWGLVIAIKLFPGLLFFFTLKERRYRVFYCMLLSTLILCLWPLYTKGIIIYNEYIQGVKDVVWYGISWNASFYGFISRMLNTHQQLIQLGYVLFFLSAVYWYLKMLRPTNMQHHGFCLTLVMMLILSPFGWLYYFSLLLMPLLVTVRALNTGGVKSSTTIYLWAFCVVCLNIPYDIVLYKTAPFIEKISIYSLYFYGLIILNYLLCSASNVSVMEHTPSKLHARYKIPLLISLSLSTMIVLRALLTHYYMMHIA